MVYDLNIPCNTHTTVNDKAVVHILKSLTLRKTVDKMLTVNGDINHPPLIKKKIFLFSAPTSAYESRRKR